MILPLTFASFDFPMTSSQKNIFYILFGVIFVSILNVLLVSVEKDAEGSSITSFSDSIWYMIVTLTTVGYGDMYPISSVGKIIGYVYVFSSLGILGFLFSTISNRIYTMLEEKKLGFQGTDFKDHIIFFGWNDFSKLVAGEIIHTNKKLAILTENKDSVDLIYDQFGKKNLFVLFSEYQNPEALQKLNASEAAVIFLAIQNDSDALMLVINIKNQYPNAKMVVSLQNSKLKSTFMAAGVTYIIAHNEIASKLVASYIFEPDVAELNTDLISSARKDTDFDIQEYKVISSNPYKGKTGLQVFHALKDDHDVILVGLSKVINGERKLIPNPKKDTIIEESDYLIVMADGQAKHRLEDIFKVEEGRVY